MCLYLCQCTQCAACHAGLKHLSYFQWGCASCSFVWEKECCEVLVLVGKFGSVLPPNAQGTCCSVNLIFRMRNALLKLSMAGNILLATALPLAFLSEQACCKVLG